MNTKQKSKITLISILIIAFITLGISIGVCLYNYYGYVSYKIQYLEDYFDVNEKHNLTNQEKIDRYQKWSSHAYTNSLNNITYRDPITKEEITTTKVSSDSAQNVNAYIDGTTLHLPKYFDLDFYSFVTKGTNSEGETSYTLSYNFYFSNIDYNQIPDFDPQYIYMTFVDGIGEESDKLLQEAIDDTLDSGVSVGIVSRLCTQSILSESGESTLASISLLDKARNVFQEEDDFYYIYKNPCNKSYDGQTTFGNSKDGLTFCIYYMNDEDGTSSFINILEGTYLPELNESGKVLSGSEFIEKENLTNGYSQNYYQESYREFARPKLIKSGLIAFACALLVSGLFVFVWVYDSFCDDSTLKTKKRK